MTVQSTPDRADGFVTHEEAAAHYMTQVGLLKLALHEIANAKPEWSDAGSYAGGETYYHFASRLQGIARGALARSQDQHFGVRGTLEPRLSKEEREKRRTGPRLSDLPRSHEPDREESSS